MIAAASLAARAVTIDPDQADYYRGLGQELFSRWEDVTGEDYRSVDMGIKRTEYREDRYRKGALRALEHSLRLLPSAEAHVSMGHLLAPNGRAIRKAETRLALRHLEAAITLSPATVEADEAQRIALLHDALTCPISPAAQSDDEDEEDDDAVFDAGERVYASARMGATCGAYRRWARLHPFATEPRSVLHYDCGRRLIHARPRPVGSAPARWPCFVSFGGGGDVNAPRGAENLVHAAAALSSADAVRRAAEVFLQRGTVVFENAVSSELSVALGDALREVSEEEREESQGSELRTDTVGVTSKGEHRWHAAQPCGTGMSGRAILAMAARLSGFLTAILGVETAEEVVLLECASIVSYPGAVAQSWHADSDWDAACDASTVVTQLALADLSDPTLGAIEVRPFVASLDDTVDLPMRAPAGTVVAYDSKVTHRGGENSNELGTARPVLYTTWAARDDGLLPRNLGYTIEADDVGRWTLQGLVDAHAKPKAKTKRRKRR